MLRTAVAIRHVHFEDLGTFEAVLTAAGYNIHYYDIGVHELWTLDAVKPELLVVLGGPVGVGDTHAYPFLMEEIDLLRLRLRANRPTLGICLGAQLIAAALGAAVTPAGGKEIGFSPLILTTAGEAGPLRHLTNVPVLHWHGDTFDIPKGATHLAATEVCAHQGFAMGSNILSLQFHAEADASAGIERWLVGHAAELAAARIDPSRLREEAALAGSDLRKAARAMFTEWLGALEP